MKYLLDTNICIYLIKRRPESIFRVLTSQEAGSVALSTVTVAELYHGAARSQNPERNRAALEQFLIPLVLADFDLEAAITFGVIKTALERNGTPIGPLDTMIAAHALSLDLTLVTNNEREFRHVRELKITNWVSDY